MSAEHMGVLYKDICGFHKGKTVTTFDIPEVRVGYKEPGYQVVKDICVDDGHPSPPRSSPCHCEPPATVVGFPSIVKPVEGGVIPDPPLKNQEPEKKGSTGNSLYLLLQSEKTESDDIYDDDNKEEVIKERLGGELGVVGERGRRSSPGGGGCTPAKWDGFSEGRESISGAITFSGPVVCAGNLSIRSDSSTTSTRSFTFPILQQEWNSSPVRMVECEDRHLVKHRWWRQGLLCCRF